MARSNEKHSTLCFAGKFVAWEQSIVDAPSLGQNKAGRASFSLPLYADILLVQRMHHEII
jgi:hypothetical protein